MPHDNGHILAINPGSTSTKFGVYTRDGAELVRTIRHSEEELAQFHGRPVLSQHNFRAAQIRCELEKAGYDAGGFDAVAGRGGLLPPVPSGTFLVDAAMLEELRLAREGEHASNLGGMLAHSFAEAAGVNAYVVDPVSVDEWQPLARISGSTLMPRTPLCHALNTKAVTRRFAREEHREYTSLRLIVAHMGSGTCVSAHENGRMIDNNTGEDGPFGVDRSGTLPVRPLIRACFSGTYTQHQLEELVFGSGGIVDYLGTRDLIEVERRIDEGEAKAVLVFNAMVYQIAKEAGAMAAVLRGEVDAILLTGGMAKSARLVSQLSEYLRWIAPIRVYPGEDELQSLADGVFRVLSGEEQVQRLQRKSPTLDAVAG
ncbi:MAG: butyrate kinase [Candidatus Korobacteraceae bacterium]|jgi:butyrate kinase